MQKSSTSINLLKQDFFDLSGDQPAGFMARSHVMALCVSYSDMCAEKTPGDGKGAATSTPKRPNGNTETEKKAMKKPKVKP